MSTYKPASSSSSSSSSRRLARSDGGFLLLLPRRRRQTIGTEDKSTGESRNRRKGRRLWLCLPPLLYLHFLIQAQAMFVLLVAHTELQQFFSALSTFLVLSTSCNSSGPSTSSHHHHYRHHHHHFLLPSHFRETTSP